MCWGFDVYSTKAPHLILRKLTPRKIFFIFG
ncbi:unnamed protein product [Arabidopsis thaliana]|uniref:Uncharacterized protein n=1 Tax=Arabidopsis thaliana TaxID=3702 RepID=A0A5S9YI46_ARATH|nr:unnamed protein product [Arabidopsis thaliana]